jgi:tetratricopeptide (TPR) repeat protein/tRNA A-37 threonylcarbamoyl transferase component Bud32
MDEPLPPRQALHVNAVCDRFEAAWKDAGPAGAPPRIEDHVGDTAEADRPALLRHLILLDIDYRRLRGEQPAARDYQPRFPSLSSAFLAGVLPASAPEAPAGNPMPGELEGIATTVLPHPVIPAMRSDRYRIRQFHAQGGIGEVWLAQDEDIGRAVALKRLRKKREEQRDRFLAEAQITGQLEHPAIVPVHDLGVDAEGRPFYVMTFVRGRTLKDALDEYHAGGPSRAEPPEVGLCRLLEAFVQVCQAVAYAHSRGVIHRDLKPDNVMLGEYGETLVLDWGMAKVRSQPENGQSYPAVQLTYASGSTETQAGTVMGSPAYMAPEVADGRAADADERTDVYLLGATLYHLLTGRVPREGNSRAELVDLARTVPPTPPRRLKPDVPRALEAICLKAMAHRKQDRYGSAGEVAADVRRYLAGAPVAAYPEPLPARAWRWCRRHRRVLGRSVAAAVVAAGLGLAAAVELRAAWQREAVARQEADERRRAQEAAEREAADLRRRDQASQDLLAFRRLCDERQFYAAFATPAGDERLHYDSPRGQRLGREALAVAGRLTAEMDQLSGKDGRAFRREYHDLFLLLAQERCRQSPGPEAVRELLEGLERAASLGGPSRGGHALRARCYELLGDEPRAAEEKQRARAADLPETALDHFLEGERCRAEAFTVTAVAERLDWGPNADLLRQAIEHYRRAAADNPGSYWAYFQMGRCYLALGQGSEAVEALDTCVALRPDQPWGYSARGLTLGLVGRFAEGDADLAKALQLDDDFRPALLNRGILAWLRQRYDAAVADFDKALEGPEEKRLLEAAYYRGQLRLERGALEEARHDFDLVVKENPTFRAVYLSRAQVQFLRGDVEAGLADLRTFLEQARAAPLPPGGPEVFALRGRLLRRLVLGWGLAPAATRTQLASARAQLEKAVELGGQAPELLDDLGAVLEWLGEPEKALPLYERALRTARPGLKVKLLVRRGQIYSQSVRPPQYDRAREDYAAALHLDPGNAEAHAALGYLHALQGTPGDAQREAAAALLHGGGDYLILHWVACIYAELSRAESEPAARQRQQDLALGLVRQALVLWRRGGRGPNELALIREEEAFRPLHGRPDFRQLLDGN